MVMFELQSCRCKLWFRAVGASYGSELWPGSVQRVDEESVSGVNTGSVSNVDHGSVPGVDMGSVSDAYYSIVLRLRPRLQSEW